VEEEGTARAMHDQQAHLLLCHGPEFLFCFGNSEAEAEEPSFRHGLAAHDRSRYTRVSRRNDGTSGLPEFSQVGVSECAIGRVE
jgi:hypothetical protein